MTMASLCFFRDSCSPNVRILMKKAAVLHVNSYIWLMAASKFIMLFVLAAMNAQDMHTA